MFFLMKLWWINYFFLTPIRLCILLTENLFPMFTEYGTRLFFNSNISQKTHLKCLMFLYIICGDQSIISESTFFCEEDDSIIIFSVLIITRI